MDAKLLSSDCFVRLSLTVHIEQNLPFGQHQPEEIRNHLIPWTLEHSQMIYSLYGARRRLSPQTKEAEQCSRLWDQMLRMLDPYPIPMQMPPIEGKKPGY